MTFWFHKRFNGSRLYYSKSIRISWYPQHWKMIKMWDNGAKRGNPKDTCYDFNIHFLGIFFAYTDWQYGITRHN